MVRSHPTDRRREAPSTPPHIEHTFATIDAVEPLPAEIRHVADDARSIVTAGERVLPVVEPLKPLMPWGGLRRGTPVAVSGAASVSLALVLAAGPSAAGSWVGVLGLEGVGLVAAAELGVDLDRLLIVRRPRRDSWAAVADALVGAVDVLLLGSGAWAAPAQVRRLAGRAREAGTVLVAVAGEREPRSGEALGPELRLEARTGRWSGLGRGHGHLESREIVVEARGRRGADRPRRTSLLLAGMGGRVEVRAPRAAWRSPQGPGAPLRILQGGTAG